MATASELCRVHFEEPDAAERVAGAVCAAAARRGEPAGPLVFLCIGTDRSTGDALGPLVGRGLHSRLVPARRVIGCLDEPVHATNLAEALAWLEGTWPGARVVAVDACLGRLESVGMITVGAGPLCPGAGVNKSLPEVGHAYVTGTVNVGGFMEYFVLQNTRLSLVVRMAEVMAEGLALAAERAESPLPARQAWEAASCLA